MKNESMTVLVVDDELPIREELRLFDWASRGVSWIGEADNGEEALRLCRSRTPDIVITDITMPAMNGIELVRRLKEELPRTQVILLTCHSEFKYAQEAVGLGAVEYLLKVAMDDDDLARALQKAKEAASRAWSLEREAADRRRRDVSEQLLRLLAGPAGQCADADAALEAALQALPVGRRPQIAALHAETGSRGRGLTAREIEDRLTPLERLHSFAWIPASDGIYWLLFETQSEGRPLPGAYRRLEAIIEALQSSLDERHAFPGGADRLHAVAGGCARPAGRACTGGAGPASGAGELSGLLRGVCEKPAAAFYDGERRVFTVQAELPAPLDDRAGKELADLLDGARWDREQLARTIRGGWLQLAMRRRIDPGELKAFAADWMSAWRRSETPLEPGWKGARRIEAAATAAELAEAMIHEIETAGGGRKARLEIAEAKRYIEANLKQPLTLAVVSAQVGLSPHYLSKLFREETGIPFNDYVTGKRIERAAYLLRNTALRVYEVAQEVGIPSYRYFAGVFREVTGVSPTELKKSAQEQGRPGERNG
ncbi:response regulator [Paenibacillus humicola]|uniref:response regulator n=1 Tax=Paenibacillus humicola TaxID=3110540 RepID=UPI00237C1AFE|nr:response regulator [Paenibacillus humicola]